MTHENDRLHRREHRSILLAPAGWHEATADPALDHMPGLLAQHVRDVYCDYRRRYDDHAIYRCGGRVLRYDGGTDRRGVVYPPFWPRLAKHLVRIQANPPAFMWLQFEKARYCQARVPLPPDLLTDGARLDYLTYAEDEERRLIARMESERMQICGEARIVVEGLHWEPERAMRYAVGKEFGMPVTPLLRYCLAVEHGFEQLAQDYHDAALLHYVFLRSFFDRGDACHVPSCLQAEGSRLVERLLSEADE